ncbi:MAG: prolipoprotein diacylglyceryl transferase [Bdellovibrionota bacterium]
MIILPKISPELISIGPLAIRWYSLMYLLGYVVGFKIAQKRIERGLLKISREALDSWVTDRVVGMLIGARVFYVVFYNWSYYTDNPSELLMFWLGGLSFHGAAVGMIISSWLFARKNKISFFSATDSLAIAAGPGLFFGRIGNFINGELFGREAHVPWAMVFPSDPQHIPRHPSQIYQGLTEGLLLWFILNYIQNKSIRDGKFRHGLVGGSFLLGYGIIRFLIEFTREPDAQVGYLFSWITMGQLLCAAMMIAGIVVLYIARSTPIVKNIK